MNRTWRHRGLAAAMGIVAALALMGAKAVETEKQVAARRAQAAKVAAALFVSKGDLKSAETVTVLAQRQQQVDDKGLTGEHLAYFVQVLHEDLDPLVLCKSLGAMIGWARQGKLKAAEEGRLKAEARKLFDHKEMLVRGYAINLTAALKDKAAAGEVGKAAKFDPDAWVRSQAEKVLPLLQE